MCTSLCVDLSFQFCGIYPGVKLLGRMVTLYLSFWGSTKLFDKVAAVIYIPAGCVWWFQFLYILTNACYGQSFLL